MNYITRYYKTLSEDLQRRLNLLEQVAGLTGQKQVAGLTGQEKVWTTGRKAQKTGQQSSSPQDSSTQQDSTQVSKEKPKRFPRWNPEGKTLTPEQERLWKWAYYSMREEDEEFDQQERKIEQEIEDERLDEIIKQAQERKAANEAAKATEEELRNKIYNHQWFGSSKETKLDSIYINTALANAIGNVAQPQSGSTGSYTEEDRQRTDILMNAFLDGLIKADQKKNPKDWLLTK